MSLMQGTVEQKQRNDLAAYYHAQLEKSKLAKEYIKRMRYSKAVVHTFGIGYAPKSEYSRLANRVIFPLRDIHGDVQALQGRKLSPADEGPKYWHTPYDKSRHLYGFYEYMQEGEHTPLLVCEGPKCPLALAEIGVPAVALFGTSISIKQLWLLATNQKTIYDALDNDEAGMKASLILQRLCAEHGLKYKNAKAPHPYKAWSDAYEVLTTDEFYRLYTS